MESWVPSPAIGALLRLQGGVVARRQLVAAGASENDVRRWLRRRLLVPLHPGVYVDHTGSPTWLQRAWAAVLLAWPAALHGSSALRAWDGPVAPGAGDGEIHVAVDRHRTSPAPVDGVVVHHVTQLEETVLWNLSPPRRRLEESVLDVALGAHDDLAAVAALARACGGRRTTADRLLGTLATRPRARRRSWLEGVLRDVRDGTHSVLEHGYLVLVERPHGLPRARRQPTARGTLGLVYRDASYGDGAHVELDSRLFHDSTEQRDRDLDRDLDALAEGGQTARLGWGQVFARPCVTAVRVVRFLRRVGVQVEARPCGPGCPVDTLARTSA